jgi:hypothetical protein
MIGAGTPTLRLRALCRGLMVSGVGFIASRPGLHRLIKRLYRFVPGLREFVRRFMPAQLLPEVRPIDRDLYIFKPVLVPDEASDVVTVEHLYHLSRSL